MIIQHSLNIEQVAPYKRTYESFGGGVKRLAAQCMYVGFVVLPDPRCVCAGNPGGQIFQPRAYFYPREEARESVRETFDSFCGDD